MRGLRLSGEKNHLRHLREGFNFLGFNIRHYPTPKQLTQWVQAVDQTDPDSTNAALAVIAIISINRRSTLRS